MKRKRNECFKTIKLVVSYGKVIVWTRIPNDKKPTNEDIGKRVWIAGDTSTKITNLISIHKKGDKYWPEFDGYTVLTNDRKCNIHKRTVRLHPINFKRKTKKQK